MSIRSVTIKALLIGPVIIFKSIKDADDIFLSNSLALMG